MHIMNKNKKTITLSLTMVLAAVLMLCGCDQKGGGEERTEYIAVQMSEGDNWSIIDKDGKVVVEEEYPAEAFISAIRDGVFWVHQDGKFQLFSIENPKQPITDDEFTSVTNFNGGRAAVTIANQPIRIINVKGATVATLSENIRYCFPFSNDGYAIFRTFDNKSGIINASGKIVVNAEYSSLESISEGVALAQKAPEDKEMLILDMNGKQQGEINTEKYNLRFAGLHESKFLAMPQDTENGSVIALDKNGKKLFDIKKAKEVPWDEYYKGGYLVFGNGKGKWGVADDKGEVVIRPKYDTMTNIGNGEFYAKKGDKMGVVNAKDETIIDFNYEYQGALMNDNYMLQDASSFSIVNKEGKELASFDKWAANSMGYAEYVNVDAIADALVRNIDIFESAKPAKQELKDSNLDIDRMHYSSSIQKNLSIFDDKLNSSFTVLYNGNLAEEKFHEEQVNDGWFTTTNRVSDGWQWTNVLPKSLNGSVVLNNLGISTHEFYELVLSKLAKGHEKQPMINEFKKRVKSGGKMLDVYTRLTECDNNELLLDIIYIPSSSVSTDVTKADSVVVVN